MNVSGVENKEYNKELVNLLEVIINGDNNVWWIYILSFMKYHFFMKNELRLFISPLYYSYGAGYASYFLVY